MKKLPIVVLALTVLVSCDFFADGFDFAAFNNMRRKWYEQNLQNYSFQQSVGDKATGPVPAEVVVGGGAVKYIRPINRYARDHQWLFLSEDYKSLPHTRIEYNEFRDDVSKIYSLIYDLAKRDSKKIGIEYNTELHYPIYFSSGSRGFSMSIDRNYYFVLDPEIPEETSLFFDSGSHEIALQMWKDLNIKNYHYSLRLLEGSVSGITDWEITVKDGVLHDVEPLNIDNGDTPHSADALAWIGSVDDIFAKLSYEAEQYTGYGGLCINVSYSGLDIPNGSDVYRRIVIPNIIYYLYISPDSPEQNRSYYLHYHNLEEHD